MGRLILVSNRLPVSIQNNSDGQSVTRSSGGLVSGLDPLHKKGDSLWIGYPGSDPTEETRSKLKEMRLEPVDIPDSEYTGFYEGFSNGAIWPLFHYLIEHCTFDAKAYAQYKQVNQRFADIVLAHAKDGDTIWVHDYQLMLLPAMLREQLPSARIGFFLHIPVPSSEVFRILPQREEILRGLLGADLIGVHTYDYADHLSRSFRRVLGLESRRGAVKFSGRETHIEAHPLGIDVKAQHDQAFSPEAERSLSAYKRSMRDRQVILGIDRLDYTKGIPLKLRAFDHLLSTSMRWQNGVVFIQVAVPSRENLQTYSDQRAEVERLVGEINGKYGGPGSTPVQYLYRTVSPAELGALYRLADIAFVSPVRDGLNLVAKEYVACRDDGGGILVLSEFAGAASEMAGALRVNPYDVEGVALQLERGLDMSLGERNERMSAMHGRVIENDVHRWVQRFMASLENPDEFATPTPPMMRSSIYSQTLVAPFAAAEKALIMLDYDGALREFTPRYEDAVPTEEILDVLKSLSALRSTEVYINSGRDRHTLAKWFADVDISLIAEHGSWIKRPGDSEWKRLGPSPDISWKAEVRLILNEYVGRTPGSRIEEKSSSLVWHYRQAEDEVGEWQSLDLASHLETMLANAPVEIMFGSKVIEIRQQGLDKGRAYNIVLDERGPFDFILATGDDRTDEDLFAQMPPDAFSIHVGEGGSLAASSLSSPAAVRRLLATLAKARV